MGKQYTATITSRQSFIGNKTCPKKGRAHMKTPHTSPIILAILIIIITTYPSPPKPSFLIATCSHHPGPDAVVQRCPGSTEPSFSAACAGALKKLHNAGDHGNYISEHQRPTSQMDDLN